MSATPLIAATAKVIGFQIRNVMRSRWLLVYGVFFFLATDALFRFGGVGATALLSLMNVVLLVIPLVTVVFGTMYVYDAREFTELLLAQPIGRRRLYLGLYAGLALPLIAGFVLGLGVPAALHGVWTTELRGTLVALLVAGSTLSAIFTAIALWVAVRIEDKVRGLGTAIALWLAFGIVYDALVLLGATMFADYPLERPLLVAMLANPVDLARVVLLLRFDISALMGYTGAVFERFFGGAAGLTVACAALALWVALPGWLGMRAFQRKDF